MMHAKKKLCKAIDEEVEDADSPRNISAHNSAASLDPATASDKMTGNMAQRKTVSMLIPHPTPLMTHTPEARWSEMQQSYVSILQSGSPECEWSAR